MASHPSLGDNPPEHGRAVRNNTRSSKNSRVKLNHLHMNQGSPLLHNFCALSCSLLHHHPSAAQGHLHASQPNLSLLHTRSPLTSAINTLLAIWYSFILSIWPNLLNTFWSTQLTTPFLHTSSFLTIYLWHANNTSQTLHLKNIHLSFLNTSLTICFCSI